MKSRVFSLFTFQMASQFPKRDNQSAEHVRSVVITTNHQHVLTTSSRMLYHGSWVIWVMGQYSVGHMGHGSLEVIHRLPWTKLLKWWKKVDRPTQIEPFWHKLRVWRTDRRTHGRAHGYNCPSMQHLHTTPLYLHDIMALYKFYY